MKDTGHDFTLMKPCMPGRNISILLNLIYFENLFRDIGFSSSHCFVPVYLSNERLLTDQCYFGFVHKDKNRVQVTRILRRNRHHLHGHISHFLIL